MYLESNYPYLHHSVKSYFYTMKICVKPYLPWLLFFPSFVIHMGEAEMKPNLSESLVRANGETTSTW